MIFKKPAPFFRQNYMTVIGYKQGGLTKCYKSPFMPSQLAAILLTPLDISDNSQKILKG